MTSSNRACFRAPKSLRRQSTTEQAQAELAHINRVTTMGELAASITHEIKQPISAASINARTCLKCLQRDVPDLLQASEAATRVVQA